MPYFSASLALSLRFAPMFCATNADRDCMYAEATSIRKPHIFSATPTPALCVRPRELTIANITRKERLTSSSCSATGAPNLNSCSAMSFSMRISARENANGIALRDIIISESTTLTACASTVAYAAPSAPILNTATSSRSPNILTTHAIATVISGIFESPMPRNMLPRRLKAIMNIVPAEHMRTYETVWLNASSGACIRADISGVNATNTTVHTAAIIAKSATPVPITLPPSSLLPSPIF